MANEGENTLWDGVIAFKRDRIMQEAANLFFERGYRQTTVDAIAERLGSAKPFVYYHFSSKIELLIEICERGTSDALAVTQRVMASKGNVRWRFEQFVREFTTAALKNHQFVAIYFREEVNLPMESADRIKNMRKTIDRSLRSLLNEGKRSGDFEIDDPRMAALVIAGMASYAFAWYKEGGPMDQQKVIEEIVKTAMKIVKDKASFAAH